MQPDEMGVDEYIEIIGSARPDFYAYGGWTAAQLLANINGESK